MLMKVKQQLQLFVHAYYINQALLDGPQMTRACPAILSLALSSAFFIITTDRFHGLSYILIILYERYIKNRFS